MGSLFRSILVSFAVVVSLASAAAAQPAADPTVAESTSADRHEVLNGKDHHFLGRVKLERGDVSIFADEAWFHADTSRFIASGNVVFSQGSNRISADRAEFDTKSGLGTFVNAYGTASVKPPVQPLRPGAIAPPPIGSREAEVYFFGDTVEKIGPKKYRITNGGFTTCVQPTPRWDLQAGTVVLNIDHYTLLRNAVFRVKGVPMFYAPLIAYPTKKEDRATGFLIPAYGSSTLRGQQIHNAFFWAIDRSQDATIMHEWYSKTGQGVSGEYRYNFGGGSDGALSTHYRRERETRYVVNGATSVLAASRTYELRGSANQMLPGRLRARGRIDYFSDLQRSQSYNTDIYNASRNQRSYGGNLVGAWGTYTLNGTFDHNEYFYGTTTSGVTGGAPRIAVTRNERPLLGSHLYLSVAGEYARILYQTRGESGGAQRVVVDKGLTRLDLNPQIRVPFRRWQWFTVNSTLAWRDTYYTRSQTAATETATPALVDEGVNRRYFTAASQVIGPVFNRIWDTPQNGYAEKFKHTIEPSLMIQRTSSIDSYDRIVQLEGVDFIVGDVTQLNYGLTNRFFAKRRNGTRAAAAREFLDVTLSQSYYTDARASQFDPRYATSFSGAPPSHYSPISLTVRAVPTDNANATMRAEFDSRYHSLRTVAANAALAVPGLLQASVGWSKRFFIPQIAQFNDARFLDHALNASAALHTRDNKYGGAYSFNYDVLHAAMLQQRMSGYYNAQCCGLAFEYQTYNFGAASTFPVASDHRFFLSFTLAGLGNFSPFNGAMNGVPR
ncbi:MAG: LPS-assembly protein LptD [Acidobacteria bacterium]|nr:LPS-assembly protein LptD [Acidobacteriota bacterium]